MGTPAPLSVTPEERRLIRLLLECWFPSLASQPFEPESARTDEYNCIAWAADDTDAWWWPVNSPDAYWPIKWRSVERDCFIAAFKTLDYEPCGTDFGAEPGVEKVVLYVDANKTPTHMARQLESGVWTSKLGEGWDIVHHTVEGVEGSAYGRAELALRRPRR